MVFTLVVDMSLRFIRLNIPFLRGSLIVPQVLGINMGPKTIFDDGNYQPSSQLQTKIEQYLQTQTGSFSLVVFDLTHEPKEQVSINSDQVYESASMYKLFVLAAVMQAEADGKLQDDDKLSATVGHLNDILGDKEYGYEDYDDDETIGWTVNEAMKRVARFSDNYSAILLAEKVGWDSVQEAANKIGATSTTIKSPISTTAQDLGLYFRKLYHGEIVSREASDRIIEMLANSNSTDRIPAQLPEDLKIAHKTGELSRIRNDGGIIFLPDRPYVFVMLTKDLKYDTDGIEAIAETSKIAYDHFTK